MIPRLGIQPVAGYRPGLPHGVPRCGWGVARYLHGDFSRTGGHPGERIRKAIKDSFIETGWDDRNTVLEELQEPEFKRFVEILRDDPKPDRGLRTLLARLEELDDYGFFDIQESRESLWESERPIVIRIHTTQNDNLQRAFASLVFYGLYKDMFEEAFKIALHTL